LTPESVVAVTVVALKLTADCVVAVTVVAFTVVAEKAVAENVVGPKTSVADVVVLIVPDRLTALSTPELLMKMFSPPPLYSRVMVESVRALTIKG